MGYYIGYKIAESYYKTRKTKNKPSKICLKSRISQSFWRTAAMKKNSNKTMKFAKYTFYIAGIYGIIASLPQYFLEEKTVAIFRPQSRIPNIITVFSASS